MLNRSLHTYFVFLIPSDRISALVILLIGIFPKDYHFAELISFMAVLFLYIVTEITELPVGDEAKMQMLSYREPSILVRHYLYLGSVATISELLLAI